VLYCVLKLCTVISTHRWAVLTVLWIGFCHTGPISLCVDLFVYLCVCCFILHACCIIVSTVGWTWLDWSLILRTYLPSVLALYSWPRSEAVVWLRARKRRSAPPYGPMWPGKDFYFILTYTFPEPQIMLFFSLAWYSRPIDGLLPPSRRLCFFSDLARSSANRIDDEVEDNFHLKIGSCGHWNKKQSISFTRLIRIWEFPFTFVTTDSTKRN